MHVYHADLNEAQADPALAALFAVGPGVTPFDRLDWLHLMARECLAPARCFIAVARDGDAIAALPLCATPRGLTALANWYSFVARPRFAHGAEHLLPALVRSLLRAGALHFGPMPRREAALMLGAAKSAGWIGALVPDHVNHVLCPAGRDFATWWATRPGQLRETVRRKRARLTIRIARDFSTADWAVYEAIYAKSWKPDEASPAFLRRFAATEGAAGRLRLGLASIDGQAVAAQLWTIEDNIAYIHKLAHDPAAAAHSPGTVLTHALFAMAFDEDTVDLIDFGTGDDRYKRDWMELTDVRQRLEAYHPRAVGQWPALAKLVAKRALRLARRAPDDRTGR
jgi:hypothetical protein